MKLSTASLILLIFLLIPSLTHSQVHTIPVSHPIYDYLFTKSIEGILPEYSPYLLPKTEDEIRSYLDSLLKREERIFGKTQDLTSDYLALLDLYLPTRRGIIEDGKFFAEEYVFADEPVALYSYQDTLVTFDLDMNGDIAFLTGENGVSASAFLLGFGGKFRFHFDKYLGFALSAVNGINFGSREIASLLPRINNSYTFNRTGRNNYDQTLGYLRFKNEYLNLTVGREKKFAGASPINRSILGSNKIDFDFLGFDIKYKNMTYSFFHGWLMNDLTKVIFDSVIVEKVKPSKYIAFARFSAQPWTNFYFGISQMIVYAYRSPELAYMTPFLFWESAQRSMNDPDNGMLSFDFSYLPISGVKINGEIIADDLNFEAYSAEGFNSLQNMTFMRVGVFLTKILPIENAWTGFEITAVRPFTFSHPGYKNALSYTNNGILLGDNIEPNSVNYSAQFYWQPTFRTTIRLTGGYKLHGQNEVSSDGSLVTNYGGDFEESYNYFTPRFHKLLAGKLKKTSSIKFSMNYRYGYHLLFVLDLVGSKFNSPMGDGKFSYVGLTLNYSPFGEEF